MTSARPDPSEGLPHPTLPDRLRADLRLAMKARDQTTIRVLRTTLAAIANAEAPPADDPPLELEVGRLVEHPRLLLSDDDIARILRDEVADREDTIDRYECGGRDAEAAPLREELSVLRSYLSPS